MSVNSFNASNPPLTTKGDLYGFSTVPTRLPVGTNAQVLTADSTASTGLKWATASGGSPVVIPRLSANYYVFPQASASSKTAVLNENSYLPIYLPACTVDRIAIRTGSLFSGTSSVRIGIYNNGTNNVPTTVLLDAGTVSCTAASTIYQITVSQTISTAGWYWLVFRTATAATTNSYTAASSTVFAFQQSSSSVGISEPGDRTVGFTESGLTGAFATAGTLSESSTNTGGLLPIVSVRIN